MLRRVRIASFFAAFVATGDSVMAALFEGRSVEVMAHRLALLLVSVAVLLAARSRDAVRRSSALAIVLVTAVVADLSVEIMRSGGLASPYLHGGALLVMFVGLFFPFDGRRIALLALGMIAILLVPSIVLRKPAFARAHVDLFILVVSTVCAVFAAHFATALRRSELLANLALLEEQQRSERLLLNILPADVASRLKSGQQSVADAFDDVTILFADIVGFTSFSSRTTPEKLVGLLDDVFSRFDRLADRYQLEKIKTIGDAYMVVGGVPTPRTDHVPAVADMAIDMLEEIRDLHDCEGAPLQIRIGINTGPVVAGVIGKRKFIYDLWGDAVNTASRMESHGEPGAIQITSAVRERLPERFQVERRGRISIKGRGEIETFFLRGRVQGRLA